MKKYLFGLVLFLSISLCGCNNGSDEQPIEEGTGIIENIADRQKESQEKSKSDVATVGESWEDAYKSIICDIDSNLADPYNYNFGSNGNVYLGIHDFNNDDIPELIIGDSVSVAVFTYESGNAVKIADLYEPEDWGGINGLCYKDNHIVLVNSGSGGSSYVCFTYYAGEYITGVYDDYNPDKGFINGNQVTGEVFRQQFNLAELTENSRIEYSKINEENEIITMVNGESTTIDDLDFQLLEWQDTTSTRASELKELMFGQVGNLGLGSFVYSVPEKDDEDYKLYFFPSQSFEEMNYSLSEAAYVFPDVREGNIPIGRFKEIYFMDMGDIFRKDTSNVIVIATYEADGTEYYDTRVYEAGESGYVVDTALTQELNEKYYNVNDYPVHEIVALPDDSQN